MVEQVNAYHLENKTHPPVVMQSLEVGTVPLQAVIVLQQVGMEPLLMGIAHLLVGMEHLLPVIILRQVGMVHLPVSMGHLLAVIILQQVGMAHLPVAMGHLPVNMVHPQMGIVSHLQVDIQPQLLGTEPQRKATMHQVQGTDLTRATQVTTRLRRNTSMSPQMLLLCQIGYCP